MRQWLVNPKILCINHLLGEHLEHHMFLGVIKKQGKLDGYLEKNLIEPLSLKKRHDELASEMLRRDYKHRSELFWDENLLKYLGDKVYKKIDVSSSLHDLISRCEVCRKRFNELKLNY